MVAPLIFVASVLCAVQSTEQSVHETFNAAVEEMRFEPPGERRVPKEYWPLQDQGVRFRVTLISTSEQAGYQGYADALFVAEGGFDLELLNTVGAGYGYSSRIDILGRLEVKSVLQIRGQTVEQCKSLVKGFAAQAWILSQQVRAKTGARVVSLPVPSDAGEAPKIVLDESRKVRYIAELDLGILIHYWGLDVQHGWAGSGAAYMYPYQYKGTELTIVQDITDKQGIIPPVIEAAYVLAQVSLNDEEESVERLKRHLPNWEVSGVVRYGDVLQCTVRKHFTFGEGSTIRSFKEYLVKAAVELGTYKA